MRKNVNNDGNNEEKKVIQKNSVSVREVEVKEIREMKYNLMRT